MAEYRVEGEDGNGNYVSAYVTASGGKDGYRKARRRAEVKLAKLGKPLPLKLDRVGCVG